MADLTNYGENIRSIQNQKASAELELAKLQEELHQSEVRQKILEKQAEVRFLADKEAELKDNILAGMLANNLKTVEFTNQRFTAKQNPASVVITAEDLIPQDFKKLKTQVVVDKTAIKKQMDFIDKVHKLGGEVLMSSHVKEFRSPERVLEIALEQQRRGADIVKIVTGANTQQEEVINLDICRLLKQELKVPFLFLSGGQYSYLHITKKTLQ